MKSTGWLVGWLALAAASAGAMMLLTSRGLLTLWVEAALMVITAIALAHAGLTAVLKWYPTSGRYAKDNDMLSGSFATLGAVYALVLGFVVVIVWQQYSDTENTVAKEANAVADLERMSRGFPVEVQRQVQAAARTYVRLVIDEEWRRMGEGSSSPRAHAALVELWSVYTDMESNQKGSPLYERSIDRLNQLGDARRARLNASNQAVPDVMWFLLYAGAVVTLFMSYMFWTGNESLHRVSITFIAAVLTFVLFLIGALESPFDVNLTIPPEPFVQALQNMRQLER